MAPVLTRGPCGVAGRLSSSSFQAVDVPAAVIPVSCQKKARWVQLPSHLVCTPSLHWHGHTSMSTVNPEPCLHLPFTHCQLLPDDTAQVWTLTGISCLSMPFQVRVSLTGFYLPIEMVPLLVCPGRFTEVAIPIAWKNGVEPCPDDPGGCLLPHRPCWEKCC